MDTDICLDLLSGRKPFNSVAEKLFSLADIDYILKSQYSAPNSRQIIAKFKTLVTVLPVDSKTIDLAIASDFADFEDAIQYYSAIENGIDLMLTRNIRDYKKATIKVMTPETFLSKPR